MKSKKNLNSFKTVVLLAILPSGVFGDVSYIPEKIPITFITQKIQIDGIQPDSKVSLASLWQNKQWAVTTRWDDNSAAANLKMSTLMERYGFKGTFYVNTDGIGQKLERVLIAKGHSIQSHSITHPGLPTCSANKVFRELLLSRIQIESRLDQPCISFSLPGTTTVRYLTK